jgi:hypothetical protein
MKLLAALIITSQLLIGPSPAHDSWISREHMMNPLTLDWCCGRGDCGIVMPAPKATPAGWAIHGEEILDLDGRRLRVDEVVPYDETLPSAGLPFVSSFPWASTVPGSLPIRPFRRRRLMQCNRTDRLAWK